MKKEDEWEDYFNYHKQNCLELYDENKSLESEINKLIYELYELTEEEINIIEESLK